MTYKKHCACVFVQEHEFSSTHEWVETCGYHSKQERELKAAKDAAERWFKAASPYATPEALSEALSKPARQLVSNTPTTFEDWWAMRAQDGTEDKLLARDAWFAAAAAYNTFAEWNAAIEAAANAVDKIEEEAGSPHTVVPAIRALMRLD
jgi:hypothetical protein